jgi:hypothetical protein
MAAARGQAKLIHCAFIVEFFPSDCLLTLSMVYSSA